ncbi:MAG: diguanylate cyclase [Rubrivivax sp.]|jgi:diguanylate cyclase (GGDEF)-like protein|nr:diguanylate cyclase [Rubrivivax sp.]
MIHALNKPAPTRATRRTTHMPAMSPVEPGAVATDETSPTAPAGRLAIRTLADGAVLLDAVEGRLRALVSGVRAEPGPGDVRSGVLECTRALGQLQALLSRERLQRAQWKAVATDAQERLAQLQRELESTREQARLAQHRALHDGLTSLPNRSHFREQLDAALRWPVDGEPTRGARPLAGVMYVDLDGMKSVNDAHGHCAGDEVLKIVAARLLHAVRAGDLVSRQGGDEFALLIAGLQPPAQAAARVAQLADSLCRSVAAPMRVGHVELSVRASIGIALHPDHGDHADTLLRNADAAMYRAKRRRDGYAFYEAAAPG